MQTFKVELIEKFSMEKFMLDSFRVSEKKNRPLRLILFVI